jgi:methionyl-tRNA synthetase
LGNEYLQSSAPWTTIKTNTDRAAMQTRMGLNLIRFYAVLSQPFIPDAAGTLLAAMRADDAPWPDDAATALAALAPGHGFAVPEVTFAKITDDQREDWQTRFSGVRT